MKHITDHSLKKGREDKGLSVWESEEGSEINQTRLNNIENAGSSHKVLTMCYLAAGLGISLYPLLKVFRILDEKMPD